MPTYEYQCKKCGQNVEAVQKFSDPALKTHEGCGGELRKVFHARGVVFKGSGFYATDSRRASAASASNGNGSKSGSAKGDTSAKTNGSKEKVSTSKDSSSSDD